MACRRQESSSDDTKSGKDCKTVQGSFKAGHTEIEMRQAGLAPKAEFRGHPETVGGNYVRETIPESNDDEPGPGLDLDLRSRFWSELTFHSYFNSAKHEMKIHYHEARDRRGRAVEVDQDDVKNVMQIDILEVRIQRRRTGVVASTIAELHPLAAGRDEVEGGGRGTTWFEVDEVKFEVRWKFDGE